MLAAAMILGLNVTSGDAGDDLDSRTHVAGQRVGGQVKGLVDLDGGVLVVDGRLREPAESVLVDGEHDADVE